MTFGVIEFTAIALLRKVLCREGVQCNVVYLGARRANVPPRVHERYQGSP